MADWKVKLKHLKKNKKFKFLTQSNILVDKDDFIASEME